MPVQVIKDSRELLIGLCKSKNRYGLYLSFDFDNSLGPNRLQTLIPFLSTAQASYFWHSEVLILLFDNETELMNYYNQINFEPRIVYVSAYSPSGNILKENI